MWNRLKRESRALAGQFANLVGLPCVIREGHYRSPSLNVSVHVRTSKLFTVVCVNGIELYFYRLSGAYDGAGVSSSPHCREAVTE